MQKQIHDLLQKEMTRQEFLTICGFGIATLVGASGLLKLLGKKNPWDQARTRSYGGGAYGS